MVAHELGHGLFNLRHTFDAEKFIAAERQTANLMDYSGGAELWKHQWLQVQDPQKMWLDWWQQEEDAEASWTIIDGKHTKLLNYVYDKNLNPYSRVDTAAYKSDEWPAAWTYSSDKPEVLVDKVVKKVKDAASGQTVAKITLRDNGIYVGKHTVGGREYATAIYSRKKEISNIKKVVVSDLDELQADSIKQHLYCENTYIKYLVLAFYEEGETEPSLVVQAAKNALEPFSSQHLEAWMRYLGVMGDTSAQSPKI